MPCTRSQGMMPVEQEEGGANSPQEESQSTPHASRVGAPVGSPAIVELSPPQEETRDVAVVRRTPPRSPSASVDRRSKKNAAKPLIEKKKTQKSTATSRASQRQAIEREHRLRMLKIEEERARLEREDKLAELSSSEEESEAEPSAAEKRTDAWVRHHTPAPTHATDEMKPDDPISQLAAALKGAFKKSRDELPSFGGDQREWLAFQAAHDEATKHGDTLSLLRRALKGAAKEAVAGLLHGGATGTDVFSQLRRKYGHPNQIIATEVQKIKELSKVNENLTGIHDFACQVQNCFATVQTLKHKGYMHSPELVSVILAKLPTLIRMRYAEFAESQDGPELEMLAQFLCRESDRAMRFTVYTEAKSAKVDAKPAAKVEAKPAKIDIKWKKEKTHATQASDAVKCTLCDEKHSMDSCSQLLSMSVSDRWSWAKEKRACFRCLRSGHPRRSCQAKTCGINGCKRTHHQLLHDEPRVVEEHSGVVATCNTEATALLKILPVTMRGPRGQVQALALLDEGSTITLVDRKLAEKIGASGRATDLNLETLSGTRRIKSQVISPEIKGQSGEWLTLRRARTTDLRLQGQRVDDKVLHSPHLVDLAGQLRYPQACPQLLIGQDNWDLIVTRELRTGRRHEPVASRTELGWVLHGHNTGHLNTYSVNTVMADELEELVRRSYDLDALGITAKPQRIKHETRALEILEATTTKKDGRFEVGLLWKVDGPPLPPSQSQAASRLKNLEKKFERDLMFAVAYRKQMDHLIDANYAEECGGPSPSSGPSTSGGPTWYLPHFAVNNPNKPGKVRIVFDAAAAVRGVSLNSQLLPGPDLLQSLLGVIMRFREGRVALTGDIAEMFLQVTIREEDRNAQRFLWRKNKEDSQPREYRMKSMLFGATSSPCTALYIKNRNAREATMDPEVLRVIEEDHYMDDAITSVNAEDEAKELLTELTRVHAQANFTIRGWASNRPDILPSQAETIVKIASSAVEHERTLGLIWNPAEDKLGFDLSLHRVPKPVTEGEQLPTKRQMLSLVMSVFDPLGLITPVTTEAKIMLQKVWRCGTAWDECIPEELQTQWHSWLEALHQIKFLRVPRHYGTQVGAEAELHVFCDASLDAYAAVAYWRFKQDEDWTTAIIASKSRVAPVKNTSVPRLELQAALIAVRLAATIVKEHRMKSQKTTFWTDSRTVLQWIRKESRNFNQFVAHRLAEIQEETTKKQWRWVPTKLNPADLATRNTPPEFCENNAWFRGPEFLQADEDDWPPSPPDPAELTSEALKEEKATILMVQPVKANEALPMVERFSSWNRLLRATEAVLQAVSIMRKKKMSTTAEELWVKEVQRTGFPEELKTLQAGRQPRSGRLKGLTVYLDEKGIIRLQGRIDAADVPMETKKPPLLDAGHQVTTLLIQHYHIMFNHGNHGTVLNEIRQKYWIPRLRTKVKKIVRSCQWCCLRRAAPMVPPTGDLPPARLSHHIRPFTFTGVDYFGPMEVTVGRRREKRWGALFTCLSTRAVHLEVVHSLSADSMIMALRRLEARRGPPLEIWSDNGTNFVGSNRILNEAWAALDLDEVAKRSDARGIRWRFIPPGAPNMGGAWERLVRSVKTALAATLKERHPRDEVLATLMAEAEHTVNSRPLTHVSEDPEDEEALTPNHFLLGSSSGAPVRGCFSDHDLIGKPTWRTAQRLADHFWQRWVKEYLPSLVPRDPRGVTTDELATGDVVLIADGTLPRNFWPRGQVEVVHRGPDGHIRIAEVRTKGGLVRRPARRMVRLTSTRRE